MASKHRLTLNLAESEYEKLCALSEAHRISMARVGRQAVIEFLKQHQNEELQLPLLSGPQDGSPSRRSQDLQPDLGK